jgi:hypothetical protein
MIPFNFNQDEVIHDHAFEWFRQEFLFGSRENTGLWFGFLALHVILLFLGRYKNTVGHQITFRIVLIAENWVTCEEERMAEMGIIIRQLDLVRPSSIGRSFVPSVCEAGK